MTLTKACLGQNIVAAPSQLPEVRSQSNTSHKRRRGRTAAHPQRNLVPYLQRQRGNTDSLLPQHLLVRGQDQGVLDISAHLCIAARRLNRELPSNLRLHV